MSPVDDFTPPTADEVAAMREGIELAKQIRAERERERERFARERHWFQEAANGRQ